MNNIKKIMYPIYFLIVSVLFINPIFISSFNLSSEDMQRLEDVDKQLQEASREIERAVEQMSPEEQAEFHQAVEQMTQIFESMSDEEFESFLTQMMSEDFDESLFEEQFLAEKLIEKETEEEAKEEEEDLSLQEFKSIISLLNSISKYVNIFLVKVSSSPDLPGKLIKWRTQGKIKNWKPDLFWNDLQNKIEQFARIVTLMEEFDITTKKVRYLTFLKENTKLQEDLTELNKKLALSVPKIEIPEFGLEKLTEASKSYAQNALNAIVEAIFVTDIPGAFAKIEEQFGPEAKKIRDSIEKQVQQSAKYSSRNLQPGSSVEVSEVSNARYQGAYLPSYSGTTSSSYPSGYSSRGISQPSGSYTPISESSSPNFSSTTPGSSSKSPVTKSQDGAATDKESNDEIARLEKQLQEKGLKDSVADEKVQKIAEGIEKIIQEIEANDLLKIKQIITKKDMSQTEFDISLKKIISIARDVLPRLNKIIIDTSDEIAAFQIKIRSLSNQQKNYYTALLKESTSIGQKTISNFVSKVTEIKYKKQKASIDIKAQWFLFKDTEAFLVLSQDNAIKTFLNEIPENCLISIDDIAENCKKFLEKLQSPEKKVSLNKYPSDKCEISNGTIEEQVVLEQNQPSSKITTVEQEDATPATVEEEEEKEIENPEKK